MMTEDRDNWRRFLSTGDPYGLRDHVIRDVGEWVTKRRSRLTGSRLWQMVQYRKSYRSRHQSVSQSVPVDREANPSHAPSIICPAAETDHVPCRGDSHCKWRWRYRTSVLIMFAVTPMITFLPLRSFVLRWLRLRLGYDSTPLCVDRMDTKARLPSIVVMQQQEVKEDSRSFTYEECL